jgi:hypothetical protein
VQLGRPVQSAWARVLLAQPTRQLVHMGFACQGLAQLLLQQASQNALAHVLQPMQRGLVKSVPWPQPWEAPQA